MIFEDIGSISLRNVGTHRQTLQRLKPKQFFFRYYVTGGF